MKPSDQSIYLICNAHIDPVWLWEEEEGMAAALSTFRTAADLCEEFEGFVFNHNEALLYQWTEELEPQLFKRIQKLVQAGRWHIMGGWYLQPDCNMPSGESFVRQILLGRRYFKEKFGVAPTSAINFDSFGHSRGLVQILARSGYDSYIFCRPDQDSCPLPVGPFVWQGYDGSRVLAIRPWDIYLSFLGKARKKIENFRAAFPNEDPGILLWGVGDHGGGPSKLDLQQLQSWMSKPQNRNIRHATPEAFFTAISKIERQLPVHTSGLNPSMVGCYTSMSQIKLKHRQLENELYRTEKMISTCWVQGLMDYPHDQLNAAMRDLAVAEFHDILPGSAIQAVEDQALRLMDHGLELLARIKARAFFSLAQGQLTAPSGEIPILVYNPHSYPVDGLVECEFQLEDQNRGEGYTVAHVFQADRLLPTQMEQEASSLTMDWRKRAVFHANLKPGQMNRYDCKLEFLPDRPRPVQPKGLDIHFDNGCMQVSINRQTGCIDSYCVEGHSYLMPDAGKVIVMLDSPDPWGMKVNSFRKVRGKFRLMSEQATARFAGMPQQSMTSVRVIEDGPVRLVVEALFHYKSSNLCVRYKLPRRGNEIELELRVYWNEKDRMVKLSLPFFDSQAQLLGQTAFGVDQLPVTGLECTAQKWVMLTNGDHALSVINDRTYGLDLKDGELRISLLRSPAYAAHPIPDRPILPPERFMPRQDQGERLFHFWIQGGNLKDRLDRIDREALIKNEPPMTLSFFPSGQGQQPLPAIRLNDEVIQVSAVKKAEDENALIIRLYEPTGTARDTILELPWAGVSYPVSLRGFEVRTIAFNLDDHHFRELNLVEEALNPTG